jgi:hypothetical protein
MTLLSGQRSQIERTGYCTLRLDSGAALLEVARELGRPVPVRPTWPLVQVLTPMTSSNALHPSLSRLHGLGTFPLHTDAAHHRQPPRWMLMRCASAGSHKCPTVLADSQRLTLGGTERRDLERAVWKVKAGSRSFLASVVLRSTLTPPSSPLRMRYDAGCMNIADAAFAPTAGKLVRWLNELPIDRIHWEPGLTIVVDNWRMLHGRGEGADDSGIRELQRVLVAG